MIIIEIWMSLNESLLMLIYNNIILLFKKIKKENKMSII